jgi:DNA mismatch repair protein MSH6
MKADLDYFNVLIPDRETVAKDGRILPKSDPEYSQALKNVADGENMMDQYLRQQQRKLKSSVRFNISVHIQVRIVITLCF